MNGAINGRPRRACTKPGRSEWATTASITAVRGSPSGPGADGGGVGFDDAARPLAVDDAHHDGARLRGW